MLYNKCGCIYARHASFTFPAVIENQLCVLIFC
jgi:hypothetical protein